MMRNIVAKVPAKVQNFRVARTQYRNNSSMSESDVPLGNLDLLVDNTAGILFKGALGVVGFVLGGLTSTGAPKNVLEDEQTVLDIKQINDEVAMSLETKSK